MTRKNRYFFVDVKKSKESSNGDIAYINDGTDEAFDECGTEIRSLSHFLELSVVFRLDLEVALRVVADRAGLGSLWPDHDMSAVCTLPDHIAVP